MHWRLNTPGEGIHHGLIIAEEGFGKTAALRLIMIEAMSSGRFVVWPADPSGRHDLDWAVPCADWIAKDPKETVRMLEMGVAAIAARRDAGGGYCDPTPERPGLLIAIDECQHVFAGNSHAVQLAEQIVTHGGPFGVGLVATSRGADLAYFGGSPTLRNGLASSNCSCAGDDAARLITRLAPHGS